MPRNSGTGVYSPPPNITAVSGAPIESADWNAKVQDDTTMFNSPWPVGLGGTGVSSLVGFLATLGGLPLAGGALTGPLTLSGDATANLHAVTRQQMDAGLAAKAATSHTQAASTITDFSTAADARIALATLNSLSDVIISTPSTGQVPQWNGTNWVNANVGGIDVVIEDQKASGTSGGSSTASVWSTRTLNTLVRNIGSLASLSANKIMLPTGSYHITWSSPNVNSSIHRTKLFNVTDAVDVAFGLTATSAGSATQTRSDGSAFVTIATATEFEIRHWCDVSYGGVGLGFASALGTEVYTRVEIRRL